jgi:hypothetical protein
MSSYAGGIYNHGTLTISHSTFSNNSAQSSGGGVFNTGGTLTITNSIFSGNTISGYHGAGGGIINYATLIINNSAFFDNSAEFGGGIYNNGGMSGMLTVTDSAFSGNSALDGGGIFNLSTLTVTDSTFSGNGSDEHNSFGGAISNYETATVMNSTFFQNFAYYGGGLHNWKTFTVTNSTFSENVAVWGGGIANSGNGMGAMGGTLTVRNSTFSANDAQYGGGIANIFIAYQNNSKLNYVNTIIANSTSGGDCYNVGDIVTNINNLVEDGSCSASMSGDPNLASLADNGGPTPTMALLSNSPAIDAGEDTGCPATDQRDVTRPQGEHCDIGAFEAEYTLVDVKIGNADMGSYRLVAHGSRRQSFVGVDNGPVKVQHQENTPIMAALRVIWQEPGVRTSYSEMMGLPKEQLSNEYWFPWYNNLSITSMDQGFRIANVDSAGNTVKVYVGGSLLDTITLSAGQSVRLGYNVDNGPAKIVCTTCSNTGTDKIIATLRVIWKEPGFRSSYSEMMGLPKEQLSSEYWFPWYNNLSVNSMDQGFRIANVDSASNTVEVYVGGSLLDTLTLTGGQSVRVGYNVDNGPARIVCTTCSNTGTDKIITALRVIWKEPGQRYSYSEMMGLPLEQLSTEYWFPWYNNATPTSMDQGFRIANVDDTSHTIKVMLGTSELASFTLDAGVSTRVGYNVDNGPIRIVCSDCSGSDKIIAALRVIWKEPGYRSSYSEMMGLPKEALFTEYWFPWYNNATPVSMDQGFRISVP